jgi:hypothetical protein
MHMNQGKCRRFGRTLTGILSSIFVLSTVVSLFAQTFNITDVRINGTDVDLQFESSTNDYYLLYTGTDLTNINRAVNVRVGQESTTAVEHLDGLTAETSNTGFYRLHRFLRNGDMHVDEATIVAQLGLEYGARKLANLLSAFQFDAQNISTNTMQTIINEDIPAPTNRIGDYAYIRPSGASAFKVSVVSPVYTNQIITNGISCVGLLGTFQYFTITCGCTNEKNGASAVLKQMVQSFSIPLSRYNVFYEDDLEMLPGPVLTFSGPVHCNDDLYVGGPLTFYDRVTSHGNIYNRRKDTGARYGGGDAVAIYDAASSNTLAMKLPDGTYLDSDNTNWMSGSLARWDGNVLSASHGVPELLTPIAPTESPHCIIEQALPTNSPLHNAQTEEEKFVNKACLILHVLTNGTCVATQVYVSATGVTNSSNVSTMFTNVMLTSTNTYNGKPIYKKNSSGMYILTNGTPSQMSNGVYDVTQTNFYNPQTNTYYGSTTGVWMRPVDIYVDRLQSVYSNLYNDSNMYAGVVYVTRDDPDSSNGVMPCVRLRNGNSITGSNGLTIVSDLPVYIEGNYNTNSTPGMTNHPPALVAGDAVTLLSPNWQDAFSRGSQDLRVPVNMTNNLVIMTGNKETKANDYSGGLENALRFLENWNSGGVQKTLTFRGSIIDLWYSRLATGTWVCTIDSRGYYQPPVRNWGYDNIYRTKAPPGMTKVYGTEKVQWQRTTWDNEDW